MSIEQWGELGRLWAFLVQRKTKTGFFSKIIRLGLVQPHILQGFLRELFPRHQPSDRCKATLLTVHLLRACIGDISERKTGFGRVKTSTNQICTPTASLFCA
ncbi:hypothetical protein ABMA58_11295 [Oceanospirillum sp. HFRX-1_2]